MTNKKRRIECTALASMVLFSTVACSAPVGTTGNSNDMQATAEQSISTTIVDGGGSQVDIPLLEVNANAKIVNLMVNGKSNPIGLDDENPAFSWQMQSNVIGAAQKYYQIIVRDDTGHIVWDSNIVESQSSQDIKYEGEPLVASTRYTWSVAVTDTAGNRVESDSAFFETGLMSTSLDAWNGAQWIGAESLSLDAASCCVFKIQTDIEIPAGSTSASLIFGAKDFRLSNSVYNINQMQNSENYVRVELDISSVNKEGGAKINVYRVGFAPSDTPAVPFLVIESENLNSLLTEENKNSPHTLSLDVCASEINISLDGQEISKSIIINDQITSSGNTSNYNTYPNLNQIGFAARAGQEAIFTNFTIENGGDYGSGILFGADIGATYQIFKDFSGISVSQDQIVVQGGEDGIICYADPSYGAAPMLRKEFTLQDKVVSARLYVTAQGIYNYYINDQEIAADEWFNPGSTEYDSYLGYNVYDVTEYVHSGDNAMGAELGEGWWTGQMTYTASNSNYFGDQPALLSMLIVEYADGQSECIVSDESWEYYIDGPIRLASFFQGERYDATKEAAIEGWTLPEYKSGSWQSAAVIETRAPFRNAALTTRKDTPVHVIRTDTAAAYLGETEPGSGTYVYDMGENLSGVPVITIPEELAVEGQTLTIRFSEILYPDTEEYRTNGLVGNLMVENYRAALVTDFYTMKAGAQTFEPDMTLHGYRYIEIGGLSEPLPVENIQRHVLSSLDATSSYSSSNELANRLYQNIVNSTTSNYISIPTDCPQRNERLGWTGDAQIFALSGSYIADTYNFMDQWMDSVRADSGDNGMSSQYSPAYNAYELEDDSIEHKGQSFGITWNCIAVTVPYNLYMQTGRTDIVMNNIENIYAYMDTLLAKPLTYKDANGEQQKEPRLTGELGNLADHLARVSTNSTLLGSCVFIACLDQAAVLADVVGDTDQAELYRQKAIDARAAWNELFLDPETKKTKTPDGEIRDTQASYATALRFNVISEDNLEQVLQNYNATITQAGGVDSDGVEILPYTITTGFNATGNLLNALSMYGLNDTAYRLFESTEYASWLYPVTVGATSVWERWNAFTEENGFNGNNSMNSFNHYSFGAVYEWMIGYQAGIIFDTEHPGYQQFILQPTVGGSYTDLTASYDSVYGTISSSWAAQDGIMTEYDVVVPANTTATLYLPTTAENAVDAIGVTYIGAGEHNATPVQVYQLVAGQYHFSMANGTVQIL